MKKKIMTLAVVTALSLCLAACNTTKTDTPVTTTTVKETTTAQETITIKETTTAQKTTTIKETTTVQETTAVKETTTAQETTTVKETTTAQETTTVKATTTAQETTTIKEKPVVDKAAICTLEEFFALESFDERYYSIYDYPYSPFSNNYTSWYQTPNESGAMKSAFFSDAEKTAAWHYLKEQLLLSEYDEMRICYVYNSRIVNDNANYIWGLTTKYRQNDDEYASEKNGWTIEEIKNQYGIDLNDFMSNAILWVPAVQETTTVKETTTTEATTEAVIEGTPRNLEFELELGFKYIGNETYVQNYNDNTLKSGETITDTYTNFNGEVEQNAATPVWKIYRPIIDGEMYYLVLFKPDGIYFDNIAYLYKVETDFLAYGTLYCSLRYDGLIADMSNWYNEDTVTNENIESFVFDNCKQYLRNDWFEEDFTTVESVIEYYKSAGLLSE